MCTHTHTSSFAHNILRHARAFRALTQKHFAFVNDSDRLTINPYSSTYSNRSCGTQVASRPLQRSTIHLALISSYRILSTLGLFRRHYTAANSIHRQHLVVSLRCSPTSTSYNDWTIVDMSSDFYASRFELPFTDYAFLSNIPDVTTSYSCLLTPYTS